MWMIHLVLLKERTELGVYQMQLLGSCTAEDCLRIFVTDRSRMGMNVFYFWTQMLSGHARARQVLMK